MTPDDPRHGTANAYVNLKCRCDACREANRVKNVAYRRRRGTPERAAWLASRRGRTHGIRSTYAHGCRCERCREAERVWKVAFRTRHRVSA